MKEATSSLIKAYGELPPNLLLHAAGWPGLRIWTRDRQIGSV
jgi:hypothetical protein